MPPVSSRQEGSLLCHEEWQTDARLERLRARPDVKNFYWLRKLSG
jgi:hypothetical protein